MAGQHGARLQCCVLREVVADILEETDDALKRGHSEAFSYLLRK